MSPSSKQRTLGSPVFLSDLKILSWNILRFASIGKDELVDLNQVAFEEIQQREDPDIMVFQEFNGKKPGKLDMILAWLPKDTYDSATAETDDMEHAYIWKRNRIRPLKPAVDQFVRPVIHEGLKRAAGTMRFLDIVLGTTLLITSVHLKSGGGEETKREFESLMEQYEPKMAARYGKTGLWDACHVVLGDFNLNPAVSGLDLGKFECTGNLRTRTSVGARGYDFFLINRNHLERHGAVQRELVQRQPKNCSLSIEGISDHDPIVLTMWPYRS